MIGVQIRLPQGAGIRELAGRASLAAGLVFALASAGQAKDLRVYYTFKAKKGGFSPSAVIPDPQGNLYGTTFTGGRACECGTVFKVAHDGTHTTLYAFKGETDGSIPETGLLRDADGNLYGAYSSTIFEIDAGGAYFELHELTPEEGQGISGDLSFGPRSILYGAAAGGGRCRTFQYGTVFRLKHK